VQVDGPREAVSDILQVLTLLLLSGRLLKLLIVLAVGLHHSSLYGLLLGAILLLGLLSIALKELPNVLHILGVLFLYEALVLAP